MTIHLKREYKRSEENAVGLQHLLQHTTLGHLLDRVEVWYDPDARNTVIDDDKDLVHDFFEFSDDAMEGYSPWVLRLVFSRQQDVIQDRKISALTLESIERTIKQKFDLSANFISSNENAPLKVMRIRIKYDDKADETIRNSEQMYLQEVAQQMGMLSLSGIPAIKRLFLKNLNEERADTSSRRYICETEGSDLQLIICEPQVNLRKTVTNDVAEVFRVLGIEGVRSSLLNV